MMHKGELCEQRFHTGTVELNYAEGPASGEALLDLHGGNGRWQGGRALLEDLASAFQVYGLDLRGHGLSGRVPGVYRLQDYVPDLATVFDQGRMHQGNDAHVLLPAIRCPVLLLQADPEAGGLTPHEEIAPALALLSRGKHVFLVEEQGCPMLVPASCFTIYSVCNSRRAASPPSSKPAIRIWLWSKTTSKRRWSKRRCCIRMRWACASRKRAGGSTCAQRIGSPIMRHIRVEGVLA